MAKGSKKTTNPTNIVVTPQLYDGKLVGLPRPSPINFRGVQKSDNAPGENPELNRFRDIFRSSADETNTHGRFINLDNGGKKEEFSSDAWADNWDSSDGYHGHVYFKRAGQEQGNYPFAKAVDDIQNYTALYDEYQKYEFLVPYIDPETGKPILAKTTDTLKGLRDRGLTPYNKFGVAKDEASVWEDVTSSALNFAGDVPDHLVGAARFLYEGMSMAHNDVQKWNDPVYRALAKAGDANEQEKMMYEFQPSKESNEAWSKNWLATGTTNAILSTAEFGMIGRGIGMTARGANAIAGAFGREGLRAAAINQIAAYGSSGIMGFGYAFNEAAAAGLNEEERFAYATLVGSLTSLIEVKLGKQFDQFLVGGGVQASARELIKEKAASLSGQGLQKYLMAKAVTLPQTVLSKVRTAAPESAEEILQSTVEQGFKLTYNYLYRNDPLKQAGEGAFDIDEFSFSELASSGLFGFLAPFPFAGSSDYARTFNEVANGNERKIRQNLSDNMAAGKITQKQYQQANSTLDQIAMQAADHEKLYGRFTGEDRNFILRLIAGPLQAKALASREIDKKLKELGDVPLDDATDASKKAKAFIEERRKRIEEANKELTKFEDVNYTDQLLKEFKDKKKAMWEARNNAFDLMATLSQYTEASSEDQLVGQISSQSPDFYKEKSAVRTPDEAAIALDAIRSGKLAPEYQSAILNDTIRKGFLFSDKVNKPENQKYFAALLSVPGDTQFESGLKRLPLNAQERQAHAQGEPVPFAQERILSPEAIQQILASEDNLNAAVDMMAKQRFGAIVASEGQMEAVKETIREEFAADNAKEKFFRMNALLTENQNGPLGIFAGLDNSNEITNLLTPQQAAAFKKVKGLAPMAPTIFMNPGKGSKFYGVFDQTKNLVAISGDFERLQQLASQAKLNNSEAKELKALREDLFHKLVHEFGGHSYLDKALTHLFGAYVDVLAGDRKREIEAQYFQRMVKLAELAYYSMRNNPDANGFYFNAIAKKYMGETDLTRKSQMSITLVKEFMAEAISNAELQAVLNSFDLNDPKNREVVEQVYNYKAPFSTTKRGLWAEVADAVSSLFTFLRNVFTKEERTILSEALHLGAGADFDQYAVGATKRTLQTAHISELAISNFDGVNLFEGESGISPEVISFQIVNRLNDRGIKLGYSRGLFTEKIRQFLNGIVKSDGEVIVEDSLKAIFFRKTDTFMLTWQYEDSAGNRSRERAFFDIYGNQVQINTNPRNSAAPLTVQKHLFKTFELADADPLKEGQLEIINNVRQAAKEGLSGEVTLELDENHTWKLGNEIITGGQINIVYNFLDGTRGVIGYTHDLSKVRLARYLKRGIALTGKVLPESESGSSEGSLARIKLDENDNIIDMMTMDNERFDSLSDEEKMQYTVTRTYNPALNLFFSEGIEISSEIQDEANRIDTITTQDDTIEPKLNSEDLSSFDRIIREGFTEAFFERNIFLSFYTPSQWEYAPGSPEQIKNFYQTSILRTSMLNAVVLKAFDRESIAKVINGLVSEVQKKMASKVDSADNLGFETKEELDAFKMFVVTKIFSTFGDGNLASRDAQDWSDRGTNPSGKISTAIKVALESESYEWEGSRYFVDFSEAEDVLFATAKATESLEGIVANVKNMIDQGDFVGRQAEVAKAVLNHLTRDYSAFPVHQKFYTEAAKSYWSQFGSIKRLDAVIFSSRHQDDPYGLAAHMKYASEYQMIKEKENEIVGKLQKRFSDIRAKAIAENKTTKDVLNSELDAFYAEKIGRDRAEQLLKKNDGNKSTLRNMIVPIKTKFDRKKLNIVSTAIKSFTAGKTQDPYQVVDGITLGNQEEYLVAVERLNTVLEYFDIQIPPSLLAIRQNAEAYNKVKEMLGYNATAAEIRSAVGSIPFNSVNTVSFELKEPGGKKKFDKYPTISLVASMIDWNLKDIGDNSARPFNEKTNYELAKQLLKHEGNNRTPKFYLNTENQKEYAFKTKSYTDDLFERLQQKNSELFKKYRTSQKYRFNTVLDAIEESNGEPIESFMVGLNAYHETNSSKTFETAGDIDFLYMHLNGFAAPANAANNSNYYYHIEDVPSDKPKNYLYRLIRIDPAAFGGEVKKIIQLEHERLQKAEARYQSAFKPDGTIKDVNEFNHLIPDVHYKRNQDGTFSKGWLFDSKNSFYEGRSAEQILSKITEEAENSYAKWTSQGLQVPLSPRFVRDLKRLEFTPEAFQAKIEGEQKRLYKEWYFNYVINRYHLSMLTMGDYIFYKPKDFVDLNKRMAGTRAPFARAIFNRKEIKVAIINDVGFNDNEFGDSVIEVPKLTGKMEQDGSETFDVSDTEYVPIVSKRTDAQGYVTEDFAAEIKEAYGSLAGYEKIFKPVMFGVSENKIEEAQPLYVKLSLAVIPNPALPENGDYFRHYPNQRIFAEKLYASSAQFAVFASGIKVGAHALNNLMDEQYMTASFDSKLFGMQNNPYHDPNSNENFLNGLLQITKQLGDNHPENKQKMERYHEIEARLIKQDINTFFAEEMQSPEGIRELVKENLGDEEFSKAIKDYMDSDINVLDSPVLAKYSENILNAIVKAKTRLYKKNGEKLVNISDLGFGRPVLDETDHEERYRILTNTFGVAEHLVRPYNTDLMWIGPRTVQDLTVPQLRKLAIEFKESKVEIGVNGFIYDTAGSVRIFPADVLVPPTSFYQIGSRTIGIRIPTSKKGSAVPGEVVGFLSEKQGNGIVYGKHGTGVLGFDFDVDGMFTWRERLSGDKNYDKAVQEMFDIAFEILIAARNFNEMISPVSTDTLSAIADTLENDVPTQRSEHSYIMKGYDSVEGDEVIIDPTDTDAFKKKVEHGGYPLEFYTFNTLFAQFYNDMTGKREKAPGSAVWRLNPETNLYSLIDVETGEAYIENVDMMTGKQHTVVPFEREVKITPAYRFSKFSPDRQIEAKKANGDGKDLIGVFASYAGIHSVFTQYGVSFGKNLYYNFGNEKLAKHTQYTLSGELVSDIFSELINAATDNAKLQLLARLGINKTTASVLNDMIAHGAPLEYSIMFINQPAVKEYIRLKENQAAAAFKGEKINYLFDAVQNSLVAKAREINPSFRYTNPIYTNSVFTNQNPAQVETKDFAAQREAGKIVNPVKLGEDRIYIDQSELQDALNKSIDELNIAAISRQIDVLNKFKLYSSRLARTTADAGKLIQLTSSFPKTFMELYNVKQTISDVAMSENIGIAGLAEHPYYAMMLDTVNNLLDRYAQFKKYAHPDMMAAHESVAAGLSIEAQQKLVDDFYSYILTSMRESDNANGRFNLSTTSLTGTDVNPWDFVHESAQVVKQLKKQFPDNEFLKLLKIVHGPKTTQDVLNRNTDPDYISSMLNYELDAKQLADVRRDFDALPENFTFIYRDSDLNQDIPVQIKSTKDVVLGHLLHTKGMTLGGFSFSKILPANVVRSFDNAVKDIAINESMIDEFFYQAAFNNNEIVKEITREDIDMFTAGKHSDKTEQPGAIYKGGVKLTYGADGNIETISFTVNNANQAVVERRKLLKIIKIKAVDGTYKFYEADKIAGANLNIYNYKLIDFNPTRTVKFYDIVNNPSQMKSVNESVDRINATDAQIEEAMKVIGDFEDEEDTQRFDWNKVMPDQTAAAPNNLIAQNFTSSAGIPMRSFDTANLDLIATEIEVKPQDKSSIVNGKKKAMSVQNIPGNALSGIKRDDLLKLNTGNGFLLVRAIKDSYAMSDVFASMKNNPKFASNAEQLLVENWASYQGIKSESVNLNTVLGLRQMQFQYIASVSQDGAITHESKEVTDFENRQRIKNKYDQAIANGLTEEEARAFARC